MHEKGTNLKINFNGITVCFDDFGKGAIPLIFIHGFPFDKSFWQPQMTFLQKTHRVIAYDVRGFGASTAGNEIKSIQLFADDLIRFMDVLGIAKAIVCGLSMGGYILLNAAHRYPERFEAMILSDTQCIADSDEARAKRSLTIEQIKAEGLENFATAFVKNIFCPASLDTKKDVVESIKKTILSTSVETTIRTLTALAQRAEMCSSLHKIAVPTLVLCGKEDTVTPPAQAIFLHHKISNSTLHLIDNAGHLANLEQPDAFNQQITDFLADGYMGKKILSTAILHALHPSKN
jgi:3-oxoadipate enol-lactonase